MQTELRAWTVKDSIELYNVNGWGRDFFTINERRPRRGDARGPGLAAASTSRSSSTTCAAAACNLPLLIRFSDILRSARRSSSAARSSRRSPRTTTRARYRGVYPIKVNQQRHVVEELVEYGRPFNLGLEAGSKPELLVALALHGQPRRADHLQRLQGPRLHRDGAARAEARPHASIIVIDRFGELETILASRRASSASGPRIGVRARLTHQGRGQVGRVDRRPLEVRPDRGRDRRRPSTGCAPTDMLDCLRAAALPHRLADHRRSARSRTRCARRAASSSSCTSWARNMRYLDVGGGLGVDYDGSPDQLPLVDELHAAGVRERRRAPGARRPATPRGVPHPDIVTESGRALVAHHSVLVFDVLGVNEMLGGQTPPSRSARTTTRCSSSSAETYAGDLAQELPGGVPRRAPAQGGGDHAVQPRLPRPARARARRAAVLGDCCEKILQASCASCPTCPTSSRASRSSSPTPTTATSRCSSRCPTTGR